MGKQQFELLRGAVRRTIQHKFRKRVRSAADGVRIEGPTPAAPCAPASNLSSGSNSRSKFFPACPSTAFHGFASKGGSQSGGENLQLLGSEGLELLISTQLSKCFYVNFCLGPSSVLTPVRNVVRGFGSLSSRGFASLSRDVSRTEEKAGEAVTDSVRGEGQGGDEGLTASVSGREVPAKKLRRRKSLVQDGIREAVVEPEVNGTAAELGLELATSVEASSSKLTRTSAVGADNDLRVENASVSSNPGTKRKRNKEGLCSEETSSQCVHTSPIFGMDATEEIPALGSVTADGSNAFSDTGCWESGSENPPDISKSDMGCYVARGSAVEVSHSEQERLRSTFTGVVDKLLQHENRQKSVTAPGGRAENTIVNDQDKHLGAGATLKSGSGSSAVEPSGKADFKDPHKVYKILQSSRGGRPFQDNQKTQLSSIFYRFSVSGWVSDQALSLYINSKFFPSAASRFRKYFIHRSSPELRSYVVSLGPTNEAVQFLFPCFAEFCIREFSDEIRRYRELVSTADMTKPDAWYPFARAMKRKVIYHKGPTNSGKTYRALKRLMESQSGIYCSPLRLLAMEVFDTVNMQGVYCNLHTGQEKKDVPFANHLSCTIEMCYINRQWEVAVIDEIQMMSDEYRGWAWTRAFLGLQADEIHVCGDPSALPLIRNLCAGTGDELVENEYERFKPLKVAEESLRGDFRNIQAGDCIVAFSRRDIFDIKREVELATKHRCCVVYGALPPETRTQQAKLFNEQDNGYDVLVASDAIGMGLNLNIRRVVFFSLDKFDGDSKKPVPPAQVKQIAGRAGRRGSIYPEGVTTTFFSQDLPYLDASLIQDFEPSTAAGLFPVYEQVELFASQLPNENFATLLERFSDTCKLDGAYFLCRYDNLKRVANMLEKVKGLSLEDRFNFCFAPVNVRDPQSMGALYRYATAFSQKIPVHVEMGVPSSSARDETELLDLEARHQVLSMYLWLSQHFPGDLFPQKEQAGELASQIAVLLGQSLVQSSRRWTRRKLKPSTNGRGRPLPNIGTGYNRKAFRPNPVRHQIALEEKVVGV
ncbi:hypothetical protein R1flu_003283 [Riccia fluitans]|uniref:RNA helicase n=1 Tax=Riccia fluitans TaxID=41844 RepID=A0ABD1Y8K2_9MARC